LLSTCGLIQKIEGMGTQKRFDCKLEQHHHIRCMQCGRVDDVDVELGNQVEDVLRKSTEYRLTGYRVDLEGICPQCGQ
jgi:Fur family ferric uptake transcriptional regulator